MDGSVSSEHALIEAITENNHLLYDKGSSNGTRLGKVVLIPNVRYNLSHGDEVIFADVSAIYHKTSSKDGELVPETPLRAGSRSVNQPSTMSTIAESPSSDTSFVEQSQGLSKQGSTNGLPAVPKICAKDEQAEQVASHSLLDEDEDMFADISYEDTTNDISKQSVSDDSIFDAPTQKRPTDRPVSVLLPAIDIHSLPGPSVLAKPAVGASDGSLSKDRRLCANTLDDREQLSDDDRESPSLFVFPNHQEPDKASAQSINEENTGAVSGKVKDFDVKEHDQPKVSNGIKSIVKKLENELHYDSETDFDSSLNNSSLITNRWSTAKTDGENMTYQESDGDETDPENVVDQIMKETQLSCENVTDSNKPKVNEMSANNNATEHPINSGISHENNSSEGKPLATEPTINLTKLQMSSSKPDGLEKDAAEYIHTAKTPPVFRRPEALVPGNEMDPKDIHNAETQHFVRQKSKLTESVSQIDSNTLEAGLKSKTLEAEKLVKDNSNDMLSSAETKTLPIKPIHESDVHMAETQGKSQAEASFPDGTEKYPETQNFEGQTSKATELANVATFGLVGTHKTIDVELIDSGDETDPEGVCSAKTQKFEGNKSKHDGFEKIDIIHSAETQKTPLVIDSGDETDPEGVCSAKTQKFEGNKSKPDGFEKIDNIHSAETQKTPLVIDSGDETDPEGMCNAKAQKFEENKSKPDGFEKIGNIHSAETQKTPLVIDSGDETDPEGVCSAKTQKFEENKSKPDGFEKIGNIHSAETQKTPLVIEQIDSGDETDPEGVYSAKTQKFEENKSKPDGFEKIGNIHSVETQKTPLVTEQIDSGDETDPEGVYSAKTQKFEENKSKPDGFEKIGNIHSPETQKTPLVIEQIDSGDETDPEGVCSAKTQMFEENKSKPDGFENQKTKSPGFEGCHIYSADTQKATDLLNVHDAQTQRFDKHKSVSNGHKDYHRCHLLETKTTHLKPIDGGNDTDPEDVYDVKTQKFGKKDTLLDEDKQLDSNDETDPQDVYKTKDQNLATQKAESINTADQNIWNAERLPLSEYSDNNSKNKTESIEVLKVASKELLSDSAIITEDSTFKKQGGLDVVKGDNGAGLYDVKGQSNQLTSASSSTNIISDTQTSALKTSKNLNTAHSEYQQQKGPQSSKKKLSLSLSRTKKMTPGNEHSPSKQVMVRKRQFLETTSSQEYFEEEIISTDIHSSETQLSQDTEKVLESDIHEAETQVFELSKKTALPEASLQSTEPVVNLVAESKHVGSSAVGTALDLKIKEGLDMCDAESSIEKTTASKFVTDTKLSSCKLIVTTATDTNMSPALQELKQHHKHNNTLEAGSSIGQENTVLSVEKRTRELHQFTKPTPKTNDSLHEIEDKPGISVTTGTTDSSSIAPTKETARNNDIVTDSPQQIEKEDLIKTPINTSVISISDNDSMQLNLSYSSNEQSGNTTQTLDGSLVCPSHSSDIAGEVQNSTGPSMPKIVVHTISDTEEEQESTISVEVLNTSDMEDRYSTRSTQPCHSSLTEYNKMVATVDQPSTYSTVKENLDPSDLDEEYTDSSTQPCNANLAEYNKSDGSLKKINKQKVTGITSDDQFSSNSTQPDSTNNKEGNVAPQPASLPIKHVEDYQQMKESQKPSKDSLRDFSDESDTDEDIKLPSTEHFMSALEKAKTLDSVQDLSCDTQHKQGVSQVEDDLQSSRPRRNPRLKPTGSEKPRLPDKHDTSPVIHIRGRGRKTTKQIKEISVCKTVKGDNVEDTNTVDSEQKKLAPTIKIGQDSAKVIRTDDFASSPIQTTKGKHNIASKRGSQDTDKRTKKRKVEKEMSDDDSGANASDESSQEKEESSVQIEPRGRSRKKNTKQEETSKIGQNIKELATAKRSKRLGKSASSEPKESKILSELLTNQKSSESNNHTSENPLKSEVVDASEESISPPSGRVSRLRKPSWKVREQSSDSGSPITMSSTKIKSPRSNAFSDSANDSESDSKILTLRLKKLPLLVPKHTNDDDTRSEQDELKSTGGQIVDSIASDQTQTSARRKRGVTKESGTVEPISQSRILRGKISGKEETTAQFISLESKREHRTKRTQSSTDEAGSSQELLNNSPSRGRLRLRKRAEEAPSSLIENKREPQGRHLQVSNTSSEDFPSSPVKGRQKRGHTVTNREIPTPSDIAETRLMQTKLQECKESSQDTTSLSVQGKQEVRNIPEETKAQVPSLVIKTTGLQRGKKTREVVEKTASKKVLESPTQGRRSVSVSEESLPSPLVTEKTRPQRGKKREASVEKSSQESVVGSSGRAKHRRVTASEEKDRAPTLVKRTTRKASSSQEPVASEEKDRAPTLVKRTTRKASSSQESENEVMRSPKQKRAKAGTVIFSSRSKTGLKEELATVSEHLSSDASESHGIKPTRSKKTIDIKASKDIQTTTVSDQRKNRLGESKTIQEEPVTGISRRGTRARTDTLSEENTMFLTSSPVATRGKRGMKKTTVTSQEEIGGTEGVAVDEADHHTTKKKMSRRNQSAVKGNKPSASSPIITVDDDISAKRIGRKKTESKVSSANIVNTTVEYDKSSPKTKGLLGKRKGRHEESVDKSTGSSESEAIRRGRTRKVDESSSSESGKLSPHKMKHVEDKECDIPTKKARLSKQSTEKSASSPRTAGRDSLLRTDLRSRVLFTSTADAMQALAVTRLGGIITDSPLNCTVFVTDKVRRTCKLLTCVGRGVPVVSSTWLTESSKHGTLQDPWKYLVVDPEAEKKFCFKLGPSLQKAKASSLLAGYSVFATTSVKPPLAEMKGIVEGCGGIWLTRAPARWPKQHFVVSCEEDRATWPCLHSPAVIVTAEFLLLGVLQQKLDFKTHCLAD